MSDTDRIITTLTKLEERVCHQGKLLQEVRSDVKDVRERVSFLRGKLASVAALVGALVSVITSYFTRN